jgi:hypothetical protein
MREIEAVVATAVAGGADTPTPNLLPLFAALLPAYEYLPVLPPLPLAGAGEA